MDGRLIFLTELPNFIFFISSMGQLQKLIVKWTNAQSCQVQWGKC